MPETGGAAGSRGRLGWRHEDRAHQFSSRYEAESRWFRGREEVIGDEGIQELRRQSVRRAIHTALQSPRATRGVVKRKPEAGTGARSRPKDRKGRCPEGRAFLTVLGTVDIWANRSAAAGQGVVTWAGGAFVLSPRGLAGVAGSCQQGGACASARDRGRDGDQPCGS